jgi:hypothetical protein
MLRDEDMEWLMRVLLAHGYDRAMRLGFLEAYMRLIGGYTDEQLRQARKDDYIRRNGSALVLLHARSKTDSGSLAQRVTEAIARGDERLPEVPE